MIDVVLSPEAAALREQLRNGGMLPGTITANATEPPRIGRDTTERIGSAKRKTNPLVAGRFKDMNQFVDMTMATLTRVEVNTWLTMFRYVDSKKQTVSVSVRTVAERVGANIRHVHKAIKSLTEKGLLERVKKGGINSGASVYRVRPTVPP